MLFWRSHSLWQYLNRPKADSDHEKAWKKNCQLLNMFFDSLFTSPYSCSDEHNEKDTIFLFHYKYIMKPKETYLAWIHTVMGRAGHQTFFFYPQSWVLSPTPSPMNMYPPWYCVCPSLDTFCQRCCLKDHCCV